VTEDEAFIIAIRENPRDDTTRLVYADWLDERGDPRGEWIRIEVQLKHLVADGRLYGPLKARQRCLESDAEIAPAWLKVVRHQPSWNGGKILDWQEFYDSLLVRPYGWHQTVPKPTVSQLDEFEAATGFRLPRSYREYILVFGPGQLLTDWDIAAPGYGGSWSYDLQTMHENLSYRHPRTDEQYPVDRWRYFCAAYKDRYCWDPAEVTDPDAHEYAVYHIVEDGRVMRFADSFRGFVESIALDMLTLPGWDEDDLGSPLRFWPATRDAEPVAAPDPAG
jgi:uncharacterized protein (TIGR02996 family)